MELYQTIFVSAATGFCSVFGTGIAMKTDIAWINKMLEIHDKLPAVYLIIMIAVVTSVGILSSERY